MTDQGLDYSYSRPPIAAIKAGGYVFVSRHLCWKYPHTIGKIITPAERDALLASGIDIYLNWEYDAQDCLRGASGGRIDATEAVSQAQALDYPAGATIYHSADWDVTDAQKPTVAYYFSAARAIEQDAGYRTGCYSGYWTIKYLFDHMVIDDGWQAYAWSGGLWDTRAALRQVQNGITVGGADCDLDERVGTAYSWLKPARDPEVRMLRYTFTNYADLTDGMPGYGRVHVTDGLRYRIFPKGTVWADLAAKAGAGPITQVDGAVTGGSYGGAVAKLCGMLDTETPAAPAPADHTHPLAGGTGPAQPLDPAP